MSSDATLLLPLRDTATAIGASADSDLLFLSTVWAIVTACCLLACCLLYLELRESEVRHTPSSVLLIDHYCGHIIRIVEGTEASDEWSQADATVHTAAA